MKLKYLIVVAIILLAGAVVVVNWPKKRTKKAAEPNTGSGPANTSTTNGTKPAGDAAPVISSFDPENLLDSIYEDCTCVFCSRNIDLYTKLLALSDADLITAYKYWDYWEYDDTETLASMIANESSITYKKFGELQDQLAARFKKLSLK